VSLGEIDPSSELWAKWETLLGVFQGGFIAVFSMARQELIAVIVAVPYRLSIANHGAHVPAMVA